MKTTKITYWVCTTIIFLFEGVLPALTSHTQIAIDGIRHLGYPDYFRIQLAIFKTLGGLVLILPNVPHRFKEWAYVGFGITFISAAIGHGNVDGINFQTFFPLILLAILGASYISYYKLNARKFETR